MINRVFEDVMDETLDLFTNSGVSKSVLSTARKYAIFVKSRGIYRNRVILTACCVYLASLKTRKPLTRREVATIANVTEMSIKSNSNLYNLILKEIYPTN